jgi:glycosyltransferase involved in cell wall biosynthesis
MNRPKSIDLHMMGKEMKLGIIGSAGVPNRYGGFESFLEHCGPVLSRKTKAIYVTCDASLYQDDLSAQYLGMNRVFISVKANGVFSIIHDLIAFLRIYRNSTHIMVLGVSGGLWFPFFKLMCYWGDKRLGVNIDGVEWRRSKFNNIKKQVLRFFDYLAQRFSDVVVYDNAGLAPYIYSFSRGRSVGIGYSGDHVIRNNWQCVKGTALTICRIEPENNLDMLIEGMMRSRLSHYTIVGNWNNSEYGRALRKSYQFECRLLMLDPIYEPNRLAELRESCAVYLHGHSVGGTNPSLVEMLYYDCVLCCYDVIFNRVTAGECANYFRNVDELVQCINAIVDNNFIRIDEHNRDAIRSKYTSEVIAAAYIEAMSGQSCQ